MAEIDDLEPTDANNITRWPEGMLGGQINDSARALEGILARWFKDTSGSLASSGSSNAFAVTSNRTIISLTDGIRLSFKANHSITGAATLNLNALGAKDIRRFNGSALASGDIVSGQVVDVVYSSSLDDWLMVSALAALVGSTFVDLGENAAPGNPAADTARVYAKDVGGLTMLAYRDSAGTETVLSVPARAYADYASDDAITGIIDRDDTLPQNTEGTQILSVSITLKRANSRVRLRFQGWGTYLSAASDDCLLWVAALFGSGADAIRAGLSGPASNNTVNTGNSPPTTSVVLEAEVAPGSVGPHTYTIRVGKAGASGSEIVAGTFRMNGSSAGRWFGGAAAATLVAEEVFV